MHAFVELTVRKSDLVTWPPEMNENKIQLYKAYISKTLAVFRRLICFCMIHMQIILSYNGQYSLKFLMRCRAIFYF